MRHKTGKEKKKKRKELLNIQFSICLDYCEIKSENSKSQLLISRLTYLKISVCILLLERAVFILFIKFKNHKRFQALFIKTVPIFN